MIAENGAPTIETILTPGKMTIFPEGSIHTMYNTGCTNAQLVSALNSDDSGTNNIANSLFSLPPDLLNAAFGYNNIDVNGTRNSIQPIGTGAAWGSQQCLAKCGLKYSGGGLVNTTSS
jgi:Cupin